MYYPLCITDRIRRNVPTRLPEFGRSQNPGLAGDSKPRGGRGEGVGSVKAAHAQSMGYLLVAGRGPAVKSRGEGVL